MKLKTLIFTLMFLFTAFTASADLNYATYKNYKNETAVRAFINGIGTGYLYVNADMIMRKQKPLYCQPRGIALDEDDYIKILEKEINYMNKIERISDDTPIAIILLHGLIHSYPCSIKK